MTTKHQVSLEVRNICGMKTKQKQINKKKKKKKKNFLLFLVIPTILHWFKD